MLEIVKPPLWRSAPVDTTRPYFEVVHSLFKQTAARVGRSRSDEAVAFECLLPDDPQAAEVRHAIQTDLAARLKRLAPVAGSSDELFDLLARACCHPSNLYTEVHWLPVQPDSPEPEQ